MLKNCIVKIKSKIMKKQNDIDNLRNLHDTVIRLQKQVDNSLQENHKIKIIKDDSEDNFNIKYNNFIELTKHKRSDYFELGNIRNYEEDKISYDNGKIVLIIRYELIELNNSMQIEDFYKLRNKLIKYNNLFNDATLYFESTYHTKVAFIKPWEILL